MRPSLRVGLAVTLLASVGVAASGDLQAKVVTDQQPMKIAAAEALYETEAPASFSLFTIGTLDGTEELWSVRVPRVLSYLATGDLDGEVVGINALQAEYDDRYGPGDYRPNIPVVYWSFRLTMGAGIVIIAVALVGLWLTRRGRLPGHPWVWGAAVATIPLPFIANSTGWIMAEMGRQPCTVFGVLQTYESVSPTVGAGTVATSYDTSSGEVRCPTGSRGNSLGADASEPVGRQHDRGRPVMTVRMIDEVPPTTADVPGVAVRRLRQTGDAVLKVLEIEPGSAVSAHTHERGHDGVVIAGLGALILDDRSELLTPGCVFSISPDEPHGIANRGSDPLRLVCLDCALAPASTESAANGQ